MAIGITTAQFTGKTFAERKAERKAAGNVKFKFIVMCNEPSHDGERYGEFASRKAAEAFAFDEINALGETLAGHAFCSAHSRTLSAFNFHPRFRVVREQA